MKRIHFELLLLANLAVACGSDETTTPGDSGSGGGSGIQSGTLIRIQGGRIQGDTDTGTRRFRGIPYAKPPIGALRWKAAEAPGAWQGVLEATAFGSSCPQRSWIQGPESLDENCLFLNVWTPDPAPSSPLPVMVWLPGGGNQNGAASDKSPLVGGAFLYDGRDLSASRNVVVVTINYRLGVMGFFAHDGLRTEGSMSGNQGLSDQQAALRWVRDNILAFGGDKTNVTLFGESAGSQDTCLQVVSPKARGLFQRAISESGGCTTFRKPAADAEREVKEFASAVGCSGASDELACLRSKSVDELLIDAPLDGAIADAPGGSRFNGGVPRWDFNPVVDGELIPDQPRHLVDSGNFAKVPYLLGSNDEEGRLFMIGATPPVSTEAEYLEALQRTFKDAAPNVAAHYPVSAFASPQDALVRVWGDSRLVCTTYHSARHISAQGAPAHLYNFARAIPGALEGLGPTHGVELPYVFGTLLNPSPEDGALSDGMQGYWTRFARTGDPNGEGALEWPAFSESNDKRMNFNVQTDVVSNFRRSECDFWATVYDAAIP